MFLQYPMHMDVHSSTIDCNHDSDEALMLAYAKDGNQAAFTVLYSRYKNSLYRYCVRMLNDEGLGADIYQEAWSRLIKNREKYELKAKFKTYIFHIAHNLIIDAWRKQCSQGEKIHLVSIDSNDDKGETLELMANSDVFNEIQSEEQLLQFQFAINQLSHEQRDAILLHYSQGFTLQQIADMESVGRETIKSRLRYATKKLKDLVSTMNELGTLSEVQS